MANTILNTEIATSNPQANVEQIQTTNANNIAPSVQNANSQSQIQPITIPIQIQPQVTPSGYSPTTNMQPNNNLQAVAPAQTNTAPTPQQYQNNNNSNNVVDFNQIYSSYQSAFGTNAGANKNSNTYTGIKKTSLGTTIVTPTTVNLNSVQGQYQSAYSDTINGIISQMLSNMNNGFEYDPTTDNSLRVASEYAANTTLQSLAGSGVLNSSATAERVARIVSELIPQYEEKAHDRWIEYLGQLADTAQLVMNYDSQQFQYWKDAKDREFQEKEFEYQKEQDALENAWKRVDELGFVDNDASAILGVKVGTLSGAAREAKEQREYELAKMREQYQLEYQNDVAIAKLKEELNLNSSKELAKYNAEIEKNLYAYKSNIDKSKSKELAAYQNSLSNSSKEYEYQLAQKYGTSNSNNSTNYTSYSTHDEIIKNRWGVEDILTGQIKIKDDTTNNNDEVYNYLVNAYASGRISQKDFAALVAKYGITVPAQTQSSSGNSSSNTNTNTKAFGYGNGGGIR